MPNPNEWAGIFEFPFFARRLSALPALPELQALQGLLPEPENLYVHSRQFCNCTYNVLRVCRRKSIKSYFSESATVFRIANQNSSITCQIGKHKVKYFRTREVYFYSTVNRREQTRPSVHPSKRSSIWIFCRSWLVQARVPNTSLLCP